MCNSRIKMVTPTKSKHYNKAGQQPNGRHPMAKTPQKSGGSRYHSTPSPPHKTSMDLSFKTPQNPSKSRTVELMQQQQRCKSEPKALSRGRSVTPPSLSHCSSPPIFAGPSVRMPLHQPHFHVLLPPGQAQKKLVARLDRPSALTIWYRNPKPVRKPLTIL